MYDEKKVEESLRTCKELKTYYQSNIFNNPQNVFDLDTFLPAAEAKVKSNGYEQPTRDAAFEKRLDEAIAYGNQIKKQTNRHSAEEIARETLLQRQRRTSPSYAEEEKNIRGSQEIKQTTKKREEEPEERSQAKKKREQEKEEKKLAKKRQEQEKEEKKLAKKRQEQEKEEKKLAKKKREGKKQGEPERQEQAEQLQKDTVKSEELQKQEKSEPVDKKSKKQSRKQKKREKEKSETREQESEAQATMEEEEEESFFKLLLSRFVEIVVCVAVAFGLSAAFNHYIGTQTIVEGSSMETTLHDEDSLFVDKISYRFHEPERYDIVVFPFDDETYYIKRIIGLPGEAVSIVDGVIYINGVPLEENYGLEAMSPDDNYYEQVTLGNDEYFVMGDNRNHSTDSRSSEVGFVKRDKIIGKATLRIYPFEDFGSLE